MKFSIEEILRDKKETSATQKEQSDKAYERLASDTQFRKEFHNSANNLQYDESEDLMDIPVHRRARTTITTWQRNRLEETFTIQRYPTLDKAEQLSEQLGLPQYVIKVWFQNRRAKFRKDGRKRSNRPLPSAENLPKRQFAQTFASMRFPGFNNLQHLYTTPSQSNAMSPMNQLIIQTRYPFTLDSFGNELSRRYRHNSLPELQTTPQMDSSHIKCTLKDSLPHAETCNANNEIQQRFAFCQVEKERQQMHTCCCMNCRLGTFYSKY
eukprot:gene6458-7187_t